MYLDAITATATRRFGDAIKAYTEIAKLTPDEGPVYVDLGYAYENDGQTDKALENYLKAIELNKRQYATAYLRAGIVYHRKLDEKNTVAMFDEVVVSTGIRPVKLPSASRTVALPWTR